MASNLKPTLEIKKLNDNDDDDSWRIKLVTDLKTFEMNFKESTEFIDGKEKEMK